MRYKRKWTLKDLKLGKGVVLQMDSKERVYIVAQHLADNWVALVEVDAPDSSVWWINPYKLKLDGYFLSTNYAKLIGQIQLDFARKMQALENIEKYNEKQARNSACKLFIDAQGKKAAEKEWKDFLKKGGSNA